jgi:hypothetical protein
MRTASKTKQTTFSNIHILVVSKIIISKHLNGIKEKRYQSNTISTWFCVCVCHSPPSRSGNPILHCLLFSFRRSCRVQPTLIGPRLLPVSTYHRLLLFIMCLLVCSLGTSWLLPLLPQMVTSNSIPSFI